MRDNPFADKMQADHDARIATGEFLYKSPQHLLAAKDAEIARLKEALERIGELALISSLISPGEAQKLSNIVYAAINPKEGER